MPPCSRLSRRGLETSEYASTAERRPALTASARAGVRNLRSGRKKACRRGRTKERRRNKKARKKALAFVAAIRERKDGADRTKGWDFPIPLPARCIGFGKRKCLFFRR